MNVQQELASVGIALRREVDALVAARLAQRVGNLGTEVEALRREMRLATLAERITDASLALSVKRAPLAGLSALLFRVVRRGIA